MNEKLVSIVLPVYNGEKYLAQSIESILNQSYTNLELIVVNDCSTDHSEEIILKYARKDNRIRYIKNKINSKLPQSLNNGFAQAKGEYYSWTSDDNMYHPDAIEKMVEYLENNSDKGLVCSDYNAIDGVGRLTKVFKMSGADGLRYRNTIGASFLYRKDIAARIGGYRTDLFLVEDYEYWLRISLVCDIGYIPIALYDYRYHEGSLTAQRAREINEAVSRLRWLYLEEYERIRIPNNDLFDYFDFLVEENPNRRARINNYIKFSFRHWQYLARLLKRAIKRIH